MFLAENTKQESLVRDHSRSSGPKQTLSGDAAWYVAVILMVICYLLSIHLKSKSGNPFPFTTDRSFVLQGSLLTSLVLGLQTFLQMAQVPMSARQSWA